MTDKNIHLASNRLIAQAFEAATVGKPGECVIGMYGSFAIVKLAFESVDGEKPSIRVICTDSSGNVEVREEEKFEDLHDFLINQCAIAPARIGHEYRRFVETQVTQPIPYNQRFLEAEEFNKAAEDLSLGMINSFESSGLMYSIVHNSAIRIVNTDHRKDRTNPEFYTVYVQNSAIEDPDKCLVDTESFDTLFEAVGFIRTHIEQRLFKAFMPELMK